MAAIVCQCNVLSRDNIGERARKAYNQSGISGTPDVEQTEAIIEQAREELHMDLEDQCRTCQNAWRCAVKRAANALPEVEDPQPRAACGGPMNITDLYSDFKLPEREPEEGVHTP